MLSASDLEYKKYLDLKGSLLSNRITFRCFWKCPAIAPIVRILRTTACFFFMEVHRAAAEIQQLE